MFRTAIVLLLLWASPVTLAELLAPTPLIQPGYSPPPGTEEHGIWVELDDVEVEVRRSALLIKDEELNAYISGVMCRVARDYCKDLRVYVMRNPNFNATVTANGTVQVWTGLLLRITSEDELAAVLGHELAHFTQRHALEQARRAEGAMIAGTLFDMGVFVLTGINFNVGQLSAYASALAFNRGQETEADLLGVEFMSDAGYDPTAAKRVWLGIQDEDERAVAKRREPGFFSRTHPTSQRRIHDLEAFLSSRTFDATDQSEGRKRHVEMLNRHYEMLMEDQIDTNRFGRTEAMLERHRQMGVDNSLVNFFLGEMYRQRGEEGDFERAEQAYKLSTSGAFPLPAAHHQLGYIYLKKNEPEAAKENFERYLLLEPDSGDREMIEFYLEDL